jgi:hypothetical protein
MAKRPEFDKKESAELQRIRKIRKLQKEGDGGFAPHELQNIRPVSEDVRSFKEDREFERTINAMAPAMKTNMDQEDSISKVGIGSLALGVGSGGATLPESGGIISNEEFGPQPSTNPSQDTRIDEVAKRVREQKGKEIIKSQPSKVKETIKKIAEQEGMDKKDVDQALKDVDNTTAGRDNVSGDSLPSQFSKSLSFFLPAIIGGLAGAAFEGGDGAIAGAETGMGLQKQFLDEEFRNKELNLKRQKANKAKAPKFDVTPDFEDAQTGEPIFSTTIDGIGKFVNDKGQVIPASRVSSIKERLASERNDRIDDRQKNTISERDNRNILSNKSSFRTSAVKEEISGLKNIDALKDLLQAETKIVGLIDFKMAKGIAGEVGNLAESERKAAAQIMGFKGKLVDFQEWMTSELSGTRKDEINKLIKIMSKNVKDRVVKKAKLHSKGNSKRLKVDSKDFTQELLDETGFTFSEDDKPKQKKNSVQAKIKSRSNEENRKRLKELQSKHRK